jgi:hypothetical protein
MLKIKECYRLRENLLKGDEDTQALKLRAMGLVAQSDLRRCSVAH